MGELLNLKMSKIIGGVRKFFDNFFKYPSILL